MDGDIRVPIDAGIVLLLGKSGTDYVVGTANEERRPGPHLPGEPRRRTHAADPQRGRLHDAALGRRNPARPGQRPDGSTLADAGGECPRRTDSRSRGSSPARRRSSTSAPTAWCSAAGDPNRTFWWNLTHRPHPPDRRAHGLPREHRRRPARLLHQRPATRRGAAVSPARLSDQQRLWKSCKERIVVFAPSGGRVAAIHILSDGLGPSTVRTHKARGKVLARYTTPGRFGAVTWESRRTLLLDTHGSTKTAVGEVRAARVRTGHRPQRQPVVPGQCPRAARSADPDHRQLQGQPTVGRWPKERVLPLRRASVGHLEVAGEDTQRSAALAQPDARRVRGAARPAAQTSSSTPLPRMTSRCAGTKAGIRGS